MYVLSWIVIVNVKQTTKESEFVVAIQQKDGGDHIKKS